MYASVTVHCVECLNDTVPLQSTNSRHNISTTDIITHTNTDTSQSSRAKYLSQASLLHVSSANHGNSYNRVCLSVTLQYNSSTIRPTIMRFSPNGSPKTLVYLFDEFISQHKHKYNNMREEYWPNGQHRVQPLTVGQCSKLTITALFHKLKKKQSITTRYLAM